MAKQSGGTFFEQILDILDVDFKIPLGVAEISLHVSDPAKKWWKSRRSRRELQRALRRAEEKFISSHPDDRVAQILHDFPLAAEEDFRRVVAGLLSNLDEENIGWFAKVQLEHDWGNRFDQEEIRKGIERYLPYLRHELAGVPEFREVINALRLERIDGNVIAIKDNIEKIGKDISALSEKATSSRQPVSAVSGAAPIFQVPFLHSEKFVGRGDDLERLHNTLQKGGTVGVRPAMLSGLGGIGKTQLAVEYAYKYAGNYPGGVYWVNAAHNWLDELGGLAGRVGLAADDAPEGQRTSRLVRLFIDFLKNHPGALLVFDNVEDPRSLLAPVDGWIAVNLPCRLLFTTRRRDPDLPFESVEVRVLPEDVSLQLLLGSNARQGLLKLPADDPQLVEAGTICRMLGCLPLALALASAYLGKNPGVTLAGYRKRLEREGLKALDASGADPLDLPTRHDAAVAATLAAQWKSLKDKHARLVLRGAALLGEAALIPPARLSLLTGLVKTSEEGYPSPLDEALRLLQEICLVEELGSTEIRLHPLVCAFVREGIPEPERFAETCVRRLSAALWNMTRLDDEISNRGIDAVLVDIRSCLDLLQNRSSEAGDQLAILLNVLDHEAHNLRKPFKTTLPAYVMQQTRNRALNLHASTLVKKINSYLDDSVYLWFSERTPTLRESVSQVRTFAGHSDKVLCVAIHPDGQRALSGSNDSTLRLWDLESGQSLRTFEGHAYGVESVAISPDGRCAISGSDDHTLRLWDLENGQPLHTFEGHTRNVTSVAITSDGQRALSGSEDHTLRLWDLESGECMQIIKGHTHPVTSIAVSPDDRCAVSGSWDGILRLWDLESGKCLRTFEGHAGVVTSVAITQDGRRALSGSQDNTLRLWDLESGKCLRTFKGHIDDVQTVAISPDGRRALSGSEDNTLILWDLETGDRLSTFEGHTNWVMSVVISPDGLRALSGSFDNTIRLWDLGIMQTWRTFEGRVALIISLAITPDGLRALSGSDDNIICLWDLESGRSVRIFEGHTNGITSVAITPDGRHALTGANDHTLRMWDLESGKCLHTFKGHYDRVTCVAISSDGKHALSGSDDETMRLWDVKSGKCLHTYKGLPGKDTKVAISPDGRYALSGSWDRTLRLWDMESGKCLRTFEGHTDRVTSVAISPDGRCALSGSWDHTLRLWDMESGECLRIFEGHTDYVTSVVITPDGRRALSESWDNTLCLWDLESGECLMIFVGNAGFYSMAVDNTGTLIVAGDTAGSVHFIEIRNLGKGD